MHTIKKWTECFNFFAKRLWRLNYINIESLKQCSRNRPVEAASPGGDAAHPGTGSRESALVMREAETLWSV